MSESNADNVSTERYVLLTEDFMRAWTEVVSIALITLRGCASKMAEPEKSNVKSLVRRAIEGLDIVRAQTPREVPE